MQASMAVPSHGQMASAFGIKLAFPMLNRWYVIAVLACWLASMGWLLVEKILPTLREGDRPQYVDVLPDVEAPPREVRWAIHYGDRILGQARSLSIREDDGSGRMESTVQFDKLPLREIMSNLLGALGTLLNPLLAGNDDPSMTVESKMEVNSEGRLDSFVTDLSIVDLPNLIRV